MENIKRDFEDGVVIFRGAKCKCYKNREYVKKKVRIFQNKVIVFREKK